MTPLRRRSTMLVATALVVGGLTACASDSDSSHDGAHGSAHATTSPSTTSSPATTNTMGSTSTPSAAGSADASREGDISFAQMMIPHHEQAIEMADLVLGKEGVDQRVIDLAEAIQAAQRPEIERLQGWLADWGVAPGSESTGHEGHGDGMMSADDMTALQNASGAEASRLFLEQMIVHHEGAVDMAQMQVDNGQNPDVIALAQDIIDAQTTEIQQMRDLLASL